MSGWWSGHKIMDPVDIESRFSVEDGMAFLDAVVDEEPSAESQEMLARVKSVMDLLPPREADFINLYYFKRIKQTDIASIFRVSQPTVCYRLKRAATRIKFLLSLPEVTPDDVRQTVSKVLSDPVDVEIMVQMLQTTCQSEVAKHLGVSQGFVRHRFLRSIAKMRNCDECQVCVLLFEQIAGNLVILREVQRPAWGIGASKVVM